jgi:hypothetical protein
MAVQPSDLFYSVATKAGCSYHRRHKERHPRVIAMVRMPRLLVRFRFAGLNDVQRHTFMQRFDLYMQRGGG